MKLTQKLLVAVLCSGLLLVGAGISFASLRSESCPDEARGTELADWIDAHLSEELATLSDGSDETESAQVRSQTSLRAAGFPSHTCELGSASELGVSSDKPDIGLLLVARFVDAETAGDAINELFVVQERSPDLSRGPNYVMHAFEGDPPSRTEIDLVRDCVVVGANFFNYTREQVVAITDEIASLAASAVCR